jgi:hypothetical protein
MELSKKLTGCMRSRCDLEIYLRMKSSRQKPSTDEYNDPFLFGNEPKLVWPSMMK